MVSNIKKVLFYFLIVVILAFAFYLYAYNSNQSDLNRSFDEKSLLVNGQMLEFEKLYDWPSSGLNFTYNGKSVNSFDEIKKILGQPNDKIYQDGSGIVYFDRNANRELRVYAPYKGADGNMQVGHLMLYEYTTIAYDSNFSHATQLIIYSLLGIGMQVYGFLSFDFHNYDVGLYIYLIYAAMFSFHMLMLLLSSFYKKRKTFIALLIFNICLPLVLGILYLLLFMFNVSQHGFL